MSDDIDEIDTIRRRLNKVEDERTYIMSQFEVRDERIDDLEGRMGRLEEIVLELQDTVKGVTGLAKNERSTPDKRAADIRTVLIRRAHGRDAKGAQMWWREVRDALLDLGHDDLEDEDKAKPLVHQAMKRVKNHDGFDMTTKAAVCGDGSKRKVKAIRVKLEALPGETPSKDFTTEASPSPSAEPINAGVKTENLSD